MGEKDITIQVDGCRSRKTLWQKWEDHYRNREKRPTLMRRSNKFGSAFFLFTCVSVLYVELLYLIPFYFAEYSAMTRYYMNVLCCFLHIEMLMNWLCCRFYDTTLYPTDDNPDPSNRSQASCDTEHLSLCFHDNEDLLAIKGRTPPQGQGYFSWKTCHVCQLVAPPRAHHCKVCGKCILKRDHHCYFTGVCIGFWNQRYFVMLNFYIALSVAVAFIMTRSYVGHYMTSWSDFFLPWTIVKWFMGGIETHLMLMTIHMYSVWTGFMGLAFFVWQMLIISKGLTSREYRGGLRVRCTGSVSDNFRSVFGALWGLNFIFPTQLLLKQHGDGKHWRWVRAY